MQLTTMSARLPARHRAHAELARPARARARACGSRPPRRPPRRPQRPGRGPPRAARAEHQRRPARRRLAERRQQARGVGVVGVDRARPRRSACWRRRSPARAVGRLSASASAAVLVRDRHVDAAEAGRRQRPHGLGEQLRRQRQPQVAPVVEPDGRERRVVHLRRARVRDGPAADAEVGRQQLTGDLPPRRALGVAPRRRARTGRSFDENACAPVVARLAHVEEVVLARRVGGRLERLAARVADRRRRQAAPPCACCTACRPRARRRAAAGPSCASRSGSWRRSRAASRLAAGCRSPPPPAGARLSICASRSISEAMISTS